MAAGRYGRDVPTQDTDAGERKARLERERTFHDDRFADEHRQAAAKYYAVDTGRARYEDLIDRAATAGRTVLEYGCGTGSEAFELARTGAHVVGIDISGVGVAEAKARAEREGVRAEFLLMDAEQLGYGPASFDLVCGSGILHHLDMERSLTEVRRVLKPGGTAVFYEPLGTNPIINLYRRFTPAMRSPDEHPLVPADLELMRRHFREVDVSHHNLLSLAGAILLRVPKIGDALVHALQRFDDVLFRSVPATRRFAWVTVVQLHM